MWPDYDDEEDIFACWEFPGYIAVMPKKTMAKKSAGAAGKTAKRKTGKTGAAKAK